MPHKKPPQQVTPKKWHREARKLIERQTDARVVGLHRAGRTAHLVMDVRHPTFGTASFTVAVTPKNPHHAAAGVCRDVQRWIVARVMAPAPR